MLLIAMLMVAGVACGGDKTENATDPGTDTGDDVAEEVQPETITAVATDKAVTFPAEIESEPVVVELDNQSKAGPRSLFAFGKLNEGVTPEALLDALKTKSEDDELELLVVAGGLTPKATTTLLFPEGNYIAIMPDEHDMAPAFFTVVPASGDPVAEPEAASTIETGDFFFKTEGEFAAGETSVAITNAGVQSHMIAITQGGKGAGFYLAPAPGGTIWTTFTIKKPGDYELMCYFDDAKTGKPHLKLGMTLPLKVTK